MARYSSSSSSSYGLHGGPAQQPITDRFVPIPFEDIAAAATIKQGRFDQAADMMNEISSNIYGMQSGSPADNKMLEEIKTNWANNMTNKYGMDKDLGDRFVMNEFNKDLQEIQRDPNIASIQYNTQAAGVLRQRLQEAESIHGDNKWRYRDLLDQYETYMKEGTVGLADKYGSPTLPADYTVPPPVDLGMDMHKYLSVANPDVFDEGLLRQGIFVIKKGKEELAKESLANLIGITDIDKGANFSLNDINLERAQGFLRRVSGQDIKAQATEEWKRTGNPIHGEQYTAENLRWLFDDNFSDYLKYKIYETAVPLINALSYSRDISSMIVDPYAFKQASEFEPTLPSTEVTGTLVRMPMDIRQRLDGMNQLKSGTEDVGFATRFIINNVLDKGHVAKAKFENKKDFVEAAKNQATVNITGNKDLSDKANRLMYNHPASLFSDPSSTLYVQANNIFGIDDHIRDVVARSASVYWDIEDKNISDENKPLMDLMSKMAYAEGKDWNTMNALEKTKYISKYEEKYYGDGFETKFVGPRDAYGVPYNDKNAKNISSIIFNSNDGKMSYTAEGKGDARGPYLSSQFAYDEEGNQVVMKNVIEDGVKVSYIGSLTDSNVFGPGYQLFSIGGKNYYVSGTDLDIGRQALGWSLMTPFRTFGMTSGADPMNIKLPTGPNGGSEEYQVKTYIDHSDRSNSRGVYTIEYRKGKSGKYKKITHNLQTQGDVRALEFFFNDLKEGLYSTIDPKARSMEQQPQ